MTKADPSSRSGRCLCGSVVFEAELADDHFSVCHCAMCRRWSAGPVMMIHGKGPGTVTKADGLVWYRSSEWAERGFCGKCGSNLFYRLANDPGRFLGVAVDALDDASGLSLASHIFVDAQPDRYAFADDARRLTEAEVLAEFGVSPDD